LHTSAHNSSHLRALYVEREFYCPSDTKYCSTLHMMDRSGESVSVTKRCATLEECLFTGCADVADTGYQVCSSCCEGNICNVLVPRNDSSAIFSSISPLSICISVFSVIFIMLLCI
uniref:LY6/PLAUR domain containing 6 n=1 Tax=Neolamprologus brichardi TaxID=32507 RepID=A0A3Q4FXL6_NEOBR